MRTVERSYVETSTVRLRLPSVRRMVPVSTNGLEQLSPVVWRGEDDDPGFVFDVSSDTGRFIGFFLKAGEGSMAPRMTFDDGEGFDEIHALTLKAFPFAFYHVSLERLRNLRRLRFRPCQGAGTFRFAAFDTSNAVLIAVLHYLFNLRYQNIGIIAPGAKGSAGHWATLRSTAARVVKFFRDVSRGGGVRVQEGAEDMLPVLKLAMSLKAADIEARLENGWHEGQVPLISFITPTWNTRSDYLRDLLDSFASQKASYAELVLSDDGSTNARTIADLKEAASRRGVEVLFNAINRGIAAATNAGIGAARGQWIAFIDHDDVFVPGAVAVIADAIERYPDALFFYTDEIIVDDALRPTGSFCKPAYDSVLLSGANYINHFSVFRADRLAALGRLRSDREGSQDYDLLLRYLTGAAAGSVVHIPFPAYLWRRGERSYSATYSAKSVLSARQALAVAYDVPASSIEPALLGTFHRVRLPRAHRPSVSVIIPNRDSLELIQRVVDDVRNKTTYDGCEIVIVDNGTTDKQVLAFYRRLERVGVRVDIVQEAFNFAGMSNRGAALAKGEALLFLNNDIEVIEPGWLEEMVECLSFPATGIVGARLTYPNGSVQHNGVIVGLGQAAGHWYIEAQGDHPGPMGRFTVRQTLSAVTGACMLVTRPCFEVLGGFDAERFAVAYNDIDLCLRARNAGFRTVWTPFAHLTHRESVTRGSDESGAQNTRFRIETARLQERHRTTTFIDDAYSPFFDRRYSEPTIVVPDVLPALRPSHFV